MTNETTDGTVDAYNHNLLIGITTRNAEKYLVRFLNTVETYISLFKTYKILFIDANSTDNTFNILTNWCSIEPNCCSVISQSDKLIINNPEEHKELRGINLSDTRNNIINQFRHLFGKDTLLLILDANIVNCVEFDVDGFLSAFKPEFPNWVGVFPSQKYVYYDVFALRDVPSPRPDGHELCLKNYQIEIHETKNYEVEYKYKFPYPYELGFRHVFSAFGGAALYKTEYIDIDCKYNFYEDYKEPTNEIIRFAICEHVPFNLHLCKQGPLFINTKWIVGER